MNTRTFPIGKSIALAGRIGHGSFRVNAVDGLDKATVTITARGSDMDDLLQRTRVEMRGATLLVASPRQGGLFDVWGGGFGHDALDVEVTVPSGTSMKIATFTADIDISGRAGNVDLASGSSTMSVEYVDGNLRLRSGGGDCHIGRVTGSAQVRAGAGNSSFGEVGGTLTSACGTGHLAVDTARGAVRFRTGGGSVALGAVYDDVDVVSGSGGLRIGIPTGVSARLDVATGSGRVDSQLPIENAPRTNGPTITVRARTGSGAVQLFRPAA